LVVAATSTLSRLARLRSASSRYQGVPTPTLLWAAVRLANRQK
jgi:hypothetical protein